MFRSSKNLVSRISRRNFVPVPKVSTLTLDSSLGEVYTVMYTNYPQRSIYPIVAWLGVLYYAFWSPYVSDKEKKVWLDRQQKLKSLEFHQD